MKVLVACEYSARVRDAFRKLGHDAWSCDLLPCWGDPAYHVQGDVFTVLDRGWDLLIAHPPCTYLTVTGNKWFGAKYKDRFPTRAQDRRDAISFFTALAEAPIARKAIENPVGVMSSVYRKPDQIIQPWQFGHSASKTTCLWLFNLPQLVPTNVVDKGAFTTYKSGKRMATWYADAIKLPKEQRMQVRSATFQGIADAMSAQWGSL
jgi:hypothetical protein